LAKWKAAAEPRFAVCICNAGYQASLERNKVYVCTKYMVTYAEDLGRRKMILVES